MIEHIKETVAGGKEPKVWTVLTLGHGDVVHFRLFGTFRDNANPRSSFAGVLYNDLVYEQGGGFATWVGKMAVVTDGWKGHVPYLNCNGLSVDLEVVADIPLIDVHLQFEIRSFEIR